MSNSFDTMNVPRSRGSTQEKDNPDPAPDRCRASSKETVPLHVDYRLVPLSNPASDIKSRALTHHLTQNSRHRAPSATPRSIL
jgi:hypothetical protein